MKLSSSTPLWLAAHTLLAAQGEDFFQHLRKADQHLDAEEIHDLRVASRRLREAIALFSPCFPAGELSRFDKRVKKVTRMLGTLRNTDEAILFFSQVAEEGERERRALHQLLDALAAERDEEHKEVKRGLRSLPSGDLHTAFRAACEHPTIFEKGMHDPFSPVARYAVEALRERTQGAAELLPHALREDDSEAQHRLRIAVKHLRYRLEIVSALVVREYQELHGILKGYQEVLGKLHDLDVFQGMVRDRVAEGSERQRVLDALAEKRREQFASFAEKARQAPLDRVGERAVSAING